MTQNLKDIFGEKVDVPEDIAALIDDETVEAFEGPKSLVLYFPNVFSNQSLTPINDRVSEIYPDSEAGRNKHDMRYIRIRNFGMQATNN